MDIDTGAFIFRCVIGGVIVLAIIYRIWKEGAHG